MAGQEFQKRTAVECKTAFPAEDIKVSKDESTNLFRIVQESLTNVIRHAQASRVDINLTLIDGTLELEIADNGKGISSAALEHPASFGLIGIKERVHSMGGQVDIAGKSGAGTRIRVKIPIS